MAARIIPLSLTTYAPLVAARAMTIWSDIEELDYQETTLGELLLRRRRDPAIPGEEIFEVKLGDDLFDVQSVSCE